MAMNMKKTVKISFIEEEVAKKTKALKRKEKLLTKFKKSVACALVLGPTREGVEEVMEKLMKVSFKDETKKKVDQWAIMRHTITKAQEQLQKLREENPDSIQDCMFGCEEIIDFHFDEMNIGDLCFVIHKSLNELTRRIDYLEENGEFASFPPHYAVVDADPVAAPIVNERMLFETIYRKMYKRRHPEQEHVPHSDQALLDFYAKIPKTLKAMNENQKMDDVGELGDIPSVDDSHHQASDADLATTDTMSSDTTDDVNLFF